VSLSKIRRKRELKNKRKVNKQTIGKGKRIEDALAAISTAALVARGGGTSGAY
jgi:hypothetical protein